MLLNRRPPKLFPLFLIILLLLVAWPVVLLGEVQFGGILFLCLAVWCYRLWSIHGAMSHKKCILAVHTEQGAKLGLATASGVESVQIVSAVVTNSLMLLFKVRTGQSTKQLLFFRDEFSSREYRQLYIKLNESTPIDGANRDDMSFLGG